MMPKDMAGFIDADLTRVEEAIAKHLESEVSFISEVARTCCRAAVSVFALPS